MFKQDEKDKLICELGREIIGLKEQLKEERARPCFKALYQQGRERNRRLNAENNELTARFNERRPKENSPALQLAFDEIGRLEGQLEFRQNDIDAQGRVMQSLQRERDGYREEAEHWRKCLIPEEGTRLREENRILTLRLDAQEAANDDLRSTLHSQGRECRNYAPCEEDRPSVRGWRGR